MNFTSTYHSVTKSIYLVLTLFCVSQQVYVCCGPLEKKPYNNTKVYTLIDRFEHVITLHITLPDTDPGEFISTLLYMISLFYRYVFKF